MSPSAPDDRGGSADPGPHEARSRAAWIHRRLYADILSATLAPGERLPFGALRARYGVGVGPLREALFELAGRGLVVLESQRGFHVAPVSLEDLRDVAAVRRLTEVEALDRSIVNATPRWREQVRNALDRFAGVAARAGDPRPVDADWQQAHRRLHVALISGCGSPTLLRFCADLHDRFDRYRRIAVPHRSFMAGTAGDHGDIARAALAGERETARRLLERHVDDITEVVVACFDPSRFAPRARTRRASAD